MYYIFDSDGNKRVLSEKANDLISSLNELSPKELLFEDVKFTDPFNGLSCIGLKLRRVSLAKLQMQNMILDKARFAHCDMEGVDLSGSTIKLSSIQDTILNDANLEKTNFLESSLSGLSMESVSLKGSIMKAVRACGIVLRKIDASNVNFQLADLSDVKFISSTFHGTDFREAILRDALFVASDFNKSDFSRADCKRLKFGAATTSFKDVNFSFVNMEEANIAFLRKCVNCSFRGVNLKDAILHRCKFIACDFTGVDWTNAVLKMVEFISCEGVNISKAKAKHRVDIISV